MTARPADVRFALASPVRRAAVLGDLPGWTDALQAAGIEVAAGGHFDLVVAPPGLTRDAAASGAGAVVVVGRTRRRRLPGYEVERLLVRPRLLAPLGDRTVLRHVVGLARPGSSWRHLKRRAGLAGAGMWFLPAPTQLTVGQRRPGLPYLVDAAAALGARPVDRWALTFGDGDDLQRAAIHLFRPGAVRPDWVLKVARVAGYSLPFDGDEQGLRLLAEHAPGARWTAPTLLGRDVVDGIHISLETAASGHPLNDLLHRRGGETGNRRLIDDVARWIIELGRESAVPGAGLAAERKRLRHEVAAPWRAHRRVIAALDRIDAHTSLPGVLQHNDLGSWNMVVDNGVVTVLDWESARHPGLPLWDLVYFLADALTALDGPADSATTVQRVLGLFRGQSRLSPTLFAHLRAAVATHGLPADVVGAVVTMGWLEHGRSRAQRRAALGGSPESTSEPPLGLVAGPWLDDPLLGPEWDRWQA